jgi:PAS domain S-box-containing protein
MVEIMILATGGYRSSYYVGLALAEVFVHGFLPISINIATIVALSINATYVFPILIFDDIADIKVFANNNLFLLFFMIAGLSWRFFNQRLLVNNFALQYDLAEKKQHLEDYAQQLEDMVAERTKELSYSNKRHQALFDNATDGILVMDKGGIIIDANEKACEMHGFSREALVGIHSTLLEVEEHRVQAGERFRRMLNGESLTYETAHFRKDGTRISLEVSARAISIGDETFVQAFQRDVTEKKKIQEHLFQSQKMDSIGALAGGIADDFNNLLTVVLGYVETIRKDVGANEKVLGKLTVIENAARKATGLTGQLLGFARKKDLELVPISVNDIIRDSMKLLERMMDKQISI